MIYEVTDPELRSQLCYYRNKDKQAQQEQPTETAQWNDWDTINNKLEQFGMFSLNNPYHYKGVGDWDFNIQKGYSAGENGIYYIEIYHEDADGNLTLIGETR